MRFLRLKPSSSSYLGCTQVASGQKDFSFLKKPVVRLLVGVIFLAILFLWIPFCHSIVVSIRPLETGLWIIISLVGITLFCILLYRACAADHVFQSTQQSIQLQSKQILDGTYRCIRPQILGSMVVFPVTIHSRDAFEDSMLTLTDHHLVIGLAQGGDVGTYYIQNNEEEGMRQRKAVIKKRDNDTVQRLKRLIHDTIYAYNNNNNNNNTNTTQRTFEIHVIIGSRSGPTGLSVGVYSPNFGSMLAAFIGSCLEQKSLPLNGPPPVSSSSSCNMNCWNGKKQIY